MNPNEAGWLARAAQGDEEAFASLMEIYQTPVYNLCFRMLGAPQEAEDAAQETFWRAYQALKRYDPSRPFATWLLSIAAHYCIDQQRRQRMPMIELDALPELDLPDRAPLPEKAALAREQERQLHQLLDQLGPQDRAAVIFRYWYDYSEEEIGQMLGLTVSAVKSRLHRARRLLAERWLAAHPQTAAERSESYESSAV